MPKKLMTYRLQSVSTDYIDESPGRAVKNDVSEGDTGEEIGELVEGLLFLINSFRTRHGVPAISADTRTTAHSCVSPA